MIMFKLDWGLTIPSSIAQKLTQMTVALPGLRETTVLLVMEVAVPLVLVMVRSTGMMKMMTMVTASEAHIRMECMVQIL